MNPASGHQAPPGTPLRHYALLVLVFNALLALELRRETRRPLERLTAGSLRELLVFAGATHKLSRIISREAVTAPFRSPFTRYQEALGYGEVLEEARGTGTRRALGELISCNYCMDPWVALALLYGLRYQARATRAAIGFLSAIGLADAFHVLYETVRTRGNVLTLREKTLEKKAS